MDSSDDRFGNGTEYAKHRGISKGYVSELRKKGYLVVTADGLIDFKASDRRLVLMIDRNRADGQRLRMHVGRDRASVASGPVTTATLGSVLAAAFDRSLTPLAAMVSKHLSIAPSLALEVAELSVLAVWSAADVELGDELELPVQGALAALHSDRDGLVRVVALLAAEQGELRSTD